MPGILAQLNVSPRKYSELGRLTHFKISHDYFTDWSVFIVMSGELCYSAENGGEHPLRAGELLICPPFFNISKAVVEPAEVVFLSYSGGVSMGRIPMGRLVLAVNQRIYDDIALLRRCSPDDGYAHLLQMDIWHQICAMYSDPVIPADRQISGNTLAQLLEYIDEAYCEKLSLDMLAERSGFSKSALIQNFRLHTGLTPGQYISEKRITQACKLLGSSQHTIKEIAAECGYSNEFYFSNAFRKRKGCSPSEYRRRHK